MKENLHVGSHINSHPNYDNIKWDSKKKCNGKGKCESPCEKCKSKKEK